MVLALEMIDSIVVQGPGLYIKGSMFTPNDPESLESMISDDDDNIPF